MKEHIFVIACALYEISKIVLGIKDILKDFFFFLHEESHWGKQKQFFFKLSDDVQSRLKYDSKTQE